MGRVTWALASLAAAMALLAGAHPARAGEPAASNPPPASPSAGDDPSDFGPLVEIEHIVVEGNHKTRAEVVTSALLFGPGDRLRAGDPRFLASRVRLLALGFFADGDLILERGSRPGTVIVKVVVEERQTITLQRIYVGTSRATDAWLGLEAGDSNLLGRGISVSVGAIYATGSNAVGGSDQLAARVRAAGRNLLGDGLGLRGSLFYLDAAEPVRLAGGPEDDDPRLFAAIDQRRAGGTLGVTWDAAPTWTLSLDLRVEWVRARPGGLQSIHLNDGDSAFSSLIVGVTLDDRPDPVLPSRGGRLSASVEVAEGPAADYSFGKVQASYQRWFRLARRHVVSAGAAGGFIVGDAPRFDRFYALDMNPLLPSRALDLVLSTRPPRDLLGTGANQVLVGTVSALARAEWAFRVLRRKHNLYGADLFAQVLVGGVGQLEGGRLLRPDLGFDVGLRFDTWIGIFELSVGGLVGRVPL